IDELEVEVDSLTDREEKSRRLYVIGQACEELFLRKDRAMVNYQKAFKLHPQNVRPLVRAREIYHEMGNLKMVAKLMDFQLKVERDPEVRAELLVKLAFALIDLRMLDAAREKLNEAHSCDPNAAALDEALATVSYDPEGWDQVVAPLVQQVEHVPAEQGARLLVRAARIYNFEAPEDSEREVLLRRACIVDPQNESASFLLEKLLHEQNRQEEIVELHELRASAAEVDERGSVCREIGSQWAIRFVDVSKTARFYERALQSFYDDGAEPFPGHLAAFNLLSEVKGPQGAWEELLDLADKGLEAPLLEDDLLILAQLAGKIAWKQLNDPTRAAVFFSWVRRIEPESAVLASFLADYPEAEAALEAHEAAEEDLHTDAGAEVVAEEPAEVIAEEPAEVIAEEPAEVIAEEPAEGISEEPTSVMTVEMEAAEEEAVEEEAVEEEAVEEDAVEEEAVEEEAVEEEAAEEEAVEEEAVEEEAVEEEAVEEEAVEEDAPPIAALDFHEDVDEATAEKFTEAAQAEAQSSERGIDAWRKVAQRHRKLRTPRRALARLYTEVERWNQLVEVLKEEVELVEDLDEKRAMLLQMAELYRDRLGLDPMVVNVLNQLLKLDETDVEVLNELIVQYEKMNRWTDLISNLKRKAAVVVDPEEQVELWTRVATLFEERFSNQAEAIKAFEKILELDPQNLEAIGRLKAMYERRRDWDKLIQVWQVEIDLLQSDDERAVAYVELAQLGSSKLKRPQVSMDLWSKVVEVDPQNLEALEHLEHLYERAKDWEHLSETCLRQVELTDDPQRKAQILQKLGILFSDKAKDDERAIEAWRELLELEPDNRRAQDSLKKLYLAARAYQELEDFYAAQDKYDEFIRVLERQVDSEDPETRIELYFKIADLWQSKLEKPDRAARSFEKVLALDEENLRAAEALIPLFEGGRDVKKYAQVLEIQLKHTDDPELQLERIRTLANIVEERLRDKEQAFEWYLKAFQVDSRAEWTRSESERLAGEAGRWRQLVEVYEAAYEQLSDPIDWLPIMLTVARVFEEELANVEAALSTNKRILEIEDQNPEAVAALERLYSKTEQWTELLEIFQRKIDLVEESHERKEIYLRMANLYEEEMDDPQGAIEAYRTILDIDADDVSALGALDKIYQRLERWDDLSEALLRQLTLVDLEDTQHVVGLKFRLGQLREVHLDDVVGAVDSYREILEADPEHDSARMALEQRLEDQEHQLTAANILEPIYARREDWQPLVAVKEIQLAHEEDAYTKVDLLLQIGGLWVERIGDGERAFDGYSRCFKVDPTNEVARAELERLAAIQERWEDLALLFEEATNEALDAPLQHELLMKLAAVMDDRLEKPERAIEFYRRAQDLEPEHAETLEALERLYQRGEQWAELLEVYRRKAELTMDADERQRLFSKMAYIWEEMIGNIAEAISCFNEILAQDEINIESLRALDRLYQAQEEWHELADNLTRQLALANEDHEKVQLLTRLGQLREGELAELASAVETYRQVLELDPSHRVTVAALEQLIVNEEHQLAVANILEPYYKAIADWQKLVSVYEIMVTHAYDPVRKIELLHQIADLYELAGEDLPSAFDVYGRALSEDASHEVTQSQLERLARNLGRWEALVELYNTLVADVMDEMLAVSLHMKVAAIWELELQNLAEAAEAYKRILGLDPQSVAAVDALEQIYLRGESYADLVAILLKKAEIVLDADERKQLFFRAAQINEEMLEDFTAAIDVYKMVLDIDDSDALAINALERLHLRLESWEDLKEIYVRKVELSDDMDEKKQIFYAMGQLYVDRLEDLDRAIETFQSVLDLDPDDSYGIQALDTLYQRAERWYDLLQVLERQVELAGPSPDAANFKHRIGKLWENQLGDLTRAVETYREVLAADPTHDESLAALDVIAHGDDEPVAAAQVLEPVYENGLEWVKLIDLYEVMVAHIDDPFRKLELLHQIAGLYETRVDDSAHAFEAYGRALCEDSTDEKALEHLERLAGNIDAWAELAALYEVELEKLLDPERQTEMGLRIARVYEEEMANTERAISHFRQVLEVNPDEHAAVLSLDRLFSEGAMWSDLVDILRREIRMAESEQDILDLQFRLGQLYQEQLEDLGNAIECYREILASTPGHSASIMALELLFTDGQHQLEIAEVLEPLYRMSEEWEKLVQIMEVQLERLEDAFDKVQAVQRIAEICEQRLGDHTRAFRWWGYALQFDPTADRSSEELERLARVVDGWEELSSFYLAVIDGLEDDDKRRLLKMVARVFDEEVSDAGRAEEAYLQVLQLDEIDAEALEALDRIYTEGAMASELAEVLKRRIGTTDSSEDLVELQLRLGQTFEAALSDDDSAVESYNEALDADSRNARALDALEQIFFRRMQWQELHGTYEKMIDIQPGDDGIADCYARMAKISSDALSDPEQAQDLWNRVLDLRGEDPVALWALADLYEAAGEWRELVEVLQRQVNITEEAHAQIRLYQRLGRIWGEKLERERNALESWQKVLEIDPGDIMALYAITKIYRETQAWEELAETLYRLIDIGNTSEMPDDDLKALYIQLGELQGDTLLRPQEAIDAWRKVLELQSTSFPALSALEQLLTQEARWEESVEVLELKVNVIEGAEEKIDVLMQVANTWQEKVGNNEQASGAYERVLQERAEHRVAFSALNELYREGWHWEKLVELLLGRATLTEEISERVELFQEVAKVYEEHLNSPENAFVVLQAAFKEDYTNDATVEELKRLASVTNKWNELLTECNTIVQTITDTKIKSNMYVNMGIWYGTELGQLQYAVASVGQALQLDPENQRALTVLAGFYRKTAQWPELVQVLNRNQELEEEAEKRTELLCSMAEVYEMQLSDQPQAIAAYRKALDLEDGNSEVLEALERLYRNDQQWEGLIDILERKAGIAEEPEEVITLRTRIADLFEDQLEDPQRAIESQKDVLIVESQHLPALRSLERLYEKTGQAEEYIDVLEQQLDIVESDDERISLFQRMAVVWQEQFGKPDRAADCYEKILQLDENSGGTYEALEQVYQQDNRFDDLVETYRRHINVAIDPQQRIALYQAMGQVYEVSLQDADRSVEAYTDILSFDPDHTEALDALARLYEQIEAWDRAVDVMGQLVELVDDVGYRVDVYYRLGRINEEHQDDATTAEERFAQALELDGSHFLSMTRLVEIYKARGDWAKSAQMMVRAEEHTSNQLEKARLLYDAGRAYLEELGDEEMGTDLLARTLALDPDHEEAGAPLAEVYFREERYAEVEPVLDMLIRKTDRRDNKRLQHLYYKLARSCDVLGNNDKALKYYRSAYDIDSTDLPTLRGMADLLHRTEDWERAFKIYQTILVHHRDSQASEEIVEIFYRLGNIKLKLGERKKALNMFEKALEIDPYHRSTLESVVDLQTKQNDWKAVVAAKQSLLNTADEQGQFVLHQELGEIYRDKLKDVDSAIDSYEHASGMQPSSNPVLHQLIGLFSTAERWERAVDVVLQLAELNPSNAIKARFVYSAAVILRDNLQDMMRAMELFNQSLDHQLADITESTEISPADLKAFEAMERIVTSQKDWKSQERNYRKMIKRLSPQGQKNIKTILWHALGEIYRTRLRDLQSAMEAFQVASSLDSTHMQRHEILGELYVLAGPEHADKAINEYQILIKHEPLKTEYYQALRKIYMDGKQYDKAWCMCSTLSFLKKASAEEQQFYEQYRQRGFVRAKARMTDEMWRRDVFHPDEDLFVGTIFAAVAPLVAQMTAQPHKKYGLKKKEKLDLQNNQLLFAKVFNYATSVLNVVQADLYLRHQQPTGLQMAHTTELPSFVVGQDLLQGRPEKELAFAVAKELTNLRTEHFLRRVLHGAGQLKTVLFAALKMCNNEFPVPPAEDAAVKKTIKDVRDRMHPGQLETLAGVVQRFLARGGQVDLKRWLSGVEQTCSRVGFILCNDLEVAAKMVMTEPATVGSLPPKERVKELVLYSVSEEYFRVRSELGLTIG
ncbi:MAG: tetratricopeptide repeat protein, partial [Deltaproteobacteria bacterium]|nr:tetratricopeptide repeat protein [Deltaproteobacteria bacterium]